MKTLTRVELVKLMGSGLAFQLVDVLPRDSFDREHIQGALSLPIDEIEAKAEKLLGKKEKIVVYCASFTCMASTKAAEKLIALGFTDVWDYKGGLQDYKEADLPLVGSAHLAETTSCGCCSCACER